MRKELLLKGKVRKRGESIKVVGENGSGFGVREGSKSFTWIPVNLQSKIMILMVFSLQRSPSDNPLTSNLKPQTSNHHQICTILPLHN